MNKNKMVLGDVNLNNEYQKLKAGPLEAVFDRNSLRYLKFGKQEIIRRIYVALRNERWQPAPSYIRNIQIDVREDCFKIVFDEENILNDADFSWTGTIEGTPKGEIIFTMEGIANTTFYRNRIGICVLHPVKAYAGKEYTVVHCDGKEEKGIFPKNIMPHQPLKAISKIIYALNSQLKICIEFDGDIFEMEDQRNWSDDSYKTYSTPIDLPMPVKIEKGTRVKQVVKITLVGDFSCIETESFSEKVVEIEVDTQKESEMPSVGLNLTDSIFSISKTEHKWLEALDVTYFRLDIPLFKEHYIQHFYDAVDKINKSNVSIDIVVYASEDARNELELLFKAIKRKQYNIRTCFVIHKEDADTGQSLVNLAKEVAKNEGMAFGIGAGTFRDFSFMNRAPHRYMPADSVCFPICPQVHKTDNGNLMENARSVQDMAVSARSLLNNPSVTISPITLRGTASNPRWSKSYKEDFKEIYEKLFDLRQISMFNACWTAAVLKYLCESEANAGTCFETNGLLGIMGDEKDFALTALEAEGEIVYPVYFIFQWLGRYKGSKVIHTSSNAYLKVNAMTLKKGARYSTIVFNTSGVEESYHLNVKMKNLKKAVLDAGAIMHYRKNPELFSLEKVLENTKSPSSMISPYSVVFFEYEL